VVAVVTAVAQQEPVLLVAPATHQAKVQVDLRGNRRRTQAGGHDPEFLAGAMNTNHQGRWTGTHKVDLQGLFPWSHFNGEGLGFEVTLLLAESVI